MQHQEVQKLFHVICQRDQETAPGQVRFGRAKLVKLPVLHVRPHTDLQVTHLVADGTAKPAAG